MKKFELTSEFITNAFGVKLFRLRALVEFGDVKAGDLGGYIEKEENLNQDDNAWVSGNACVSGNARVSDNATVSGNAWVSGDARVSGNAWVRDNAWVSDNATVSGNAWVSGDAWVRDNAWVSGDAWVRDNAWVSGNARVSGNACVSGNADYATVKGFGRSFRNTTFFRCNDEKIRVQCGCFFGDLNEFRAIVKRTHGDGKMAKEYLAIADLMEMHFGDERNE